MQINPSTLLNDKVALNKLANLLPHAVSAILVLALGYSLAELSWQWFAEPESASTAAPVAVTKTAGRPPQQVVSTITGSYLFGRETARAVETPSTAPVTRLNLTLRGILAATPDSYSTAIISSGKGPQGGKEEIYGIGDTIQGGVKLHEVHEDYVIIDRQGTYEKLVLTKTPGIDLQAAPGRPAAGDTARAAPSTLGEVRLEIMKNPTSFGEYALPIVVKQAGKQVGYRLKPQKKGELLSQYGIQPSDIITEINGVKLDKPENGMKALRVLSSAQSLNLTVKRGNSFVPLNIQLQ